MVTVLPKMMKIQAIGVMYVIPKEAKKDSSKD